MQTIYVQTSLRLLASFSTLATLLLGIPATAAQPPEHPPLPGATRILTLSPDNSTGKPGVIGGVQQPWLSDHEVYISAVVSSIATMPWRKQMHFCQDLRIK